MLFELFKDIPQWGLIAALFGLGFAVWILVKREFKKSSEASSELKENIAAIEKSIKRLEKQNTDAFFSFALTLKDIQNSNSNNDKEIERLQIGHEKNGEQISLINKCIDKNIKPRLQRIEGKLKIETDIGDE